MLGQRVYLADGQSVLCGCEDLSSNPRSAHRKSDMAAHTSATSVPWGGVEIVGLLDASPAPGPLTGPLHTIGHRHMHTIPTIPTYMYPEGKNIVTKSQR